MTITSIRDAKQYYFKYDVDKRIKQDQAHLIEFYTSLKTISKYVSKESKILEIGCGTGNYSIELADKCKSLLAVDLMDNLLDVLRMKTKRTKCRNISCMQLNILDIGSKIKEKFDIILCMGPLYHLNKKNDRKKCFNNLKKLAHKDTIFIFTYITSSAPLSGVFKGKLSLQSFFDIYQKGNGYLSPFYFSSPQNTEKEILQNKFEILEHKALDPLSSFFLNEVNMFNEQQYKEFVHTLSENNTKSELLLLSSHNMIIAKMKEN